MLEINQQVSCFYMYVLISLYEYILKDSNSVQIMESTFDAMINALKLVHSMSRGH